jgi:hypothetical protein
MRKFVWVCLLGLVASPSYAGSINVGGELSHAAGGAVLAGGIAGLADKYYPERRKLIGFSASTACVLVGEGLQMSEGETFSSSLQDIGAHVIGAAVGTAVADTYILSPVIEKDQAGSTVAGIMLHGSF